MWTVSCGSAYRSEISVTEICIFSEDFISAFALPLSPREEDEYSELRSELSHSQHEVNEDSRSMDQNSVSVPENQSTMVTADMGELCFLVDVMPSRSRKA